MVYWLISVGGFGYDYDELASEHTVVLFYICKWPVKSEHATSLQYKGTKIQVNFLEEIDLFFSILQHSLDAFFSFENIRTIL